MRLCAQMDTVYHDQEEKRKFRNSQPSLYTHSENTPLHFTFRLGHSESLLESG